MKKMKQNRRRRARRVDPDRVPEVRFTVLMPRELRKKLDEHSREIGISRNGFIVHLLKTGIEFGEKAGADQDLFPNFDRYMGKVMKEIEEAKAAKLR